MLNIAKEFATFPDHKFYDSCVIVVMTHGKYDSFIGSDGDEVELHKFLECFNAKNAPFLKGKPKLFFLQACRGGLYFLGIEICAKTTKFVLDTHDLGTPHRADADTPDIFKISELLSCVRTSPPRQRSYNNRNNGNNNNSGAINEYLTTAFPSPTPQQQVTSFPTARSIRIDLPYVYGNSRRRIDNNVKVLPTEGDMLIAFSTTPGYVSWRNQQSGSWFIQSICEIFSKFASSEDICSLLTRVSFFGSHLNLRCGDKKVYPFLF